MDGPIVHCPSSIVFYFSLSVDFGGGAAAERKFVTLLSKSNQNGAPCDIANTVIISPRSFRSQPPTLTGPERRSSEAGQGTCSTKPLFVFVMGVLAAGVLLA